MCGIVAIAGSEPVANRLIDGLKRLEYRGYDSAGIAISSLGKIERRRAKGKIVNLQARLEDMPMDGLTGIAHTRWATHGKPNEVNAHPHMAGDVAIVHNGIIENFRDLRAELEAAGRVFESETDSEVIAQLIAQKMDEGLTAVDAFEATLGQLHGAFALAVIFSGEESVLMGARKGSPLVLGYGEGEMYLGSDAIALAPLTRDVTYLEEGDWAVLRPDSFDIRNARGDRVNRPRVKSAVNDALIERGEYDHFMLKEIHEQPESLARSILPYIDQATQTIAVVNVPESSIAREAKAIVPTHAGPEIGVASTKAFTAQLSVLAVLALSAAKARGHLKPGDEARYVKSLLSLPRKVTEALEAEADIKAVAQTLTKAKDVLFLGRGRYFPLALEGALKLKEVSYIAVAKGTDVDQPRNLAKSVTVE